MSWSKTWTVPRLLLDLQWKFYWERIKSTEEIIFLFLKNYSFKIARYNTQINKAWINYWEISTLLSWVGEFQLQLKVKVKACYQLGHSTVITSALAVLSGLRFSTLVSTYVFNSSTQLFGLCSEVREWTFLVCYLIHIFWKRGLIFYVYIFSKKFHNKKK